MGSRSRRVEGISLDHGLVTKEKENIDNRITARAHCAMSLRARSRVHVCAGGRARYGPFASPREQNVGGSRRYGHEGRLCARGGRKSVNTV